METVLRAAHRKGGVTHPYENLQRQNLLWDKLTCIELQQKSEAGETLALWGIWSSGILISAHQFLAV